MKNKNHDKAGLDTRNVARSLLLPDAATVLKIFGARDKHLRLIGDRFGVQFSLRNGELQLEGQRGGVREAEQVLRRLIDLAETTPGIEEHTVSELLEKTSAPVVERLTEGIQLKGFKPRTDGQSVYLRRMRENHIVFCVGPAGTGKTYLAVVKAVSLLKQGKVEKIVLVRPAVEAGEKLGFLPGDMQAKVHPYLRPLFAALYNLLGFETATKLMEREVIEIIPLAYMRGQTLEKSFIILDEGQNTTREQMKMFLTRMGQGSKIVVTGDETQIDLRPESRSGLVHARKMLEGIEGIVVQRMRRSDIVRHKLVWKIVEAYNRATDSSEGGR